MSKGRYSRYDLTIIIISVVGVVLSLVFTFLVYRYYVRASRRIQQTQKNVTNATKALCSSILNPLPNSAGPTIRSHLEQTTVGEDIETACRELLGS